MIITIHNVLIKHVKINLLELIILIQYVKLGHQNAQIHLMVLVAQIYKIIVLITLLLIVVNQI